MPRVNSITENEYYVLSALQRNPLHGYGIKKEVESMTGGKKELSMASVYGSLHRLFVNNLVERKGDKVTEDRRVQRIYQITPIGVAALCERRDTLNLLQTATSLGTVEGGTCL